MTPPNVADRIRSNIIAHSVNVHRYEAGLSAKVDKMVQDLARDLIKSLTTSGLDSPRTDWQRSRMMAMLKEASKTIDAQYSSMGAFVSDELQGLVQVTGKGITSAVNDALGADLMVPHKWTKEQLASIVDGTLINGAPSAEWWSRQGADLANAFADEMRKGMLQGDTITQLRDRIMGQKIPGVNGVGKIDLRTVAKVDRGLIYTARRNAEALVRTSVISTANAAHHAAYAANSDIMAGETWCSTLDTRTCGRCSQMDQKTWPWGVEHPIPSLHWGCRCVLLPETKSWEQLAREAHGNSTLAKKLDKMDEGTRASMGGQVSGKITYPEWFDRQSDKTKAEIFGGGEIGKRKLALFKAGKLDYASMINQSGNILSIKQLEATIA